LLHPLLLPRPYEPRMPGPKPHGRKCTGLTCQKVATGNPDPSRSSDVPEHRRWESVALPAPAMAAWYLMLCGSLGGYVVTISGFWGYAEHGGRRGDERLAITGINTGVNCCGSGKGAELTSICHAVDTIRRWVLCLGWYYPGSVGQNFSLLALKKSHLTNSLHSEYPHRASMVQLPDPPASHK